MPKGLLDSVIEKGSEKKKKLVTQVRTRDGKVYSVSQTLHAQRALPQCQSTDEGTPNPPKKPKKRAWFNKANLCKDYVSIDSTRIPSLSLTSFNDDAFMSQYRYERLHRSTHWLIPGVLLVGEDPEDCVDTLISDGFTHFVSLHEWAHEYYAIYTKSTNKLISFPINDFGTANDLLTIGFVRSLLTALLCGDEGDGTKDDEAKESESYSQ